MMTDEYITRLEAARRLRVTRQRIHQMIREGKLAEISIDGHLLIPADQIEDRLSPPLVVDISSQTLTPVEMRLAEKARRRKEGWRKRFVNGVLTWERKGRSA